MSHPTIYWAQNKAVVYLRIALMGATDVKLDIENETIVFSATAQGKTWDCNFKLFKKINKEESKYRVLGQSIEVILKKDEEVKEFWT